MTARVPETVRRIDALGLTYLAHIRETASEREIAAGPAVFSKAPDSWTPGGGAVRVPSSELLCAAADAVEPGLGAALRERYGFVPAMIDHEVELGVVLLAPLDAAGLADPGHPLQLGLFVANDLSARSLQILGEGQADPMPYWSASKSFPGFLPTGESLWIPPTTDRWPELVLRTRVNGELRQEGSTSDLVSGPRALLAHVAQVTGRSFEVGDVVLTGTPSGVAFRVPRWKRQLGDRLLDRFGKLDVSIRSYVGSDRFLWPGDTITVDAGPLGEVVTRLTV